MFSFFQYNDFSYGKKSYKQNGFQYLYQKCLINLAYYLKQIFMSNTTNEILEKLKTLTLLEAAELVSQIEETFGVDASAPTGGAMVMAAAGPASIDSQEKQPPQEEKTTFDVIVEEAPGEKRVAILKILRKLTSLNLQEVKEFTASLPKALLEAISKEKAETAKLTIQAGAKVKIQQMCNQIVRF
eukprot:TRINITY_DN1424_c2_g3_i1.p3 TRINITY_DN1424_c2_g3~~TRINITY_DN1424_c2_g3_i1.p3  ORF type:complete len:185 (+),score=22.75 TRINITY_DN1424_c2_g3_i1:1213-1767(+)